MSSRSRAKKNQKEDSSSRSTASIFKNVTKEDFEEKEKEKEQQAVPSESVKEEEEDDIANAAFPFNYIYIGQDFLNDNLTFLKTVQLLVIGFFIQLLYLERAKFEKLNDNLGLILFNALGVVSAMILSHVKGADKTLPDFNYIYCVVLLLLYNIVHYSPKWFIANISLNYFIVDKLNPLFNLASSVMFHEIYKQDESLTTVQYSQIASFHFLLSTSLDYVNKKSLKKSEVQSICLIITNLLFNYELVKAQPLIIFQKLLISLVISAALVYSVYKVIPDLLTIALFSGLFYFFTTFQLTKVLGSNPVIWLYNYVKDEPRFGLLFSWLRLALVVIPLVFYLADKFSLNVKRKIWHVFVIVVLTFTPSILFDQIEFTLLSLYGVLIIFILVELLRLNEITQVGEFLAEQLSQFQDSKDVGINISYIYLLAGVTFPITYDYVINGNNVTIVRYFGLLTLGVGDTFASIIGRRFGSYKWKGSNKSVQGSVAFVVSVFAAIYLIEYAFAARVDYTNVRNWENVLVAVILGAVLEGTADLNDNLLVPVFIPITFEVLNRCY
ncbi:dolichol kinase [Spathaspora passalidarum NRRL Y-27907]|uniref:dolichol kinase n=1 Tax=Spathaspora passalidarum (strain NRRL Y-27907 / 11-Y1) TaxID=619300 RepID=G3AQF1_SPAPN|nr:dolichol kinase [Spathaspora passalidarum NRRL Y-27907]EGW31498.1 dolichol kinase [Spathaspora passalidarum NRRL Y-27907]